MLLSYGISLIDENIKYFQTHFKHPSMLGKTLVKVMLFFTFVYLLARFPIEHSLDVIFLFVTIAVLAMLLFVFPWKAFDELEVKDG